MKLKLGDIYVMMEHVKGLADLDVPIRTAFRITKLTQAITPDFEALENQRVGLVQKHGCPIEGSVNGDFEVPPENRQAFHAEFAELLDEEVEIALEPIPLSAFGDVNVSASMLMGLDKVLVDDLE